MSGEAVGHSTSPFTNQSNRRLMVLSCFAMYPSGDITAAVKIGHAISFAGYANCSPLRPGDTDVARFVRMRG